MAKGSQKGYVTLQFRDPRSGQVYSQSVKVGGREHKIYLRQKRKHDKDQAARKKALRNAEVVPAPLPPGMELM